MRMSQIKVDRHYVVNVGGQTSAMARRQAEFGEASDLRLVEVVAFGKFTQVSNGCSGYAVKELDPDSTAPACASVLMFLEGEWVGRAISPANFIMEWEEFLMKYEALEVALADYGLECAAHVARKAELLATIDADLARAGASRPDPEDNLYEAWDRYHRGSGRVVSSIVISVEAYLALLRDAGLPRAASASEEYWALEAPVCKVGR